MGAAESSSRGQGGAKVRWALKASSVMGEETGREARSEIRQGQVSGGQQVGSVRSQVR